MNKTPDSYDSSALNETVSDITVPIDYKQRIAALDCLRSVCVTAPAGSGKTELLSQRVLKLLAKVNQPEEILAITFTRKAAAEMHFRIIEALRLAQFSPKPDQAHKLVSWELAREVLSQDKARDWQLLANPNRLKIQTIDGLCSSLTRQMPILSNFGAQPRIAEHAETFYINATQSLLDKLETKSLFSKDLVTLLNHVDNDMQKVERLLVSLLGRRDQWLLHIGLGPSSQAARRVLETTLRYVIEDVLLSLKKELAPVAAELLPLMDYAGDNLLRGHKLSPIAELAGLVELPGTKVENISQWLGVTELLITKEGGWRKTVNKNAGFPTETRDGDKKQAKELKNTFVQLLSICKENKSLLDRLIEVRFLPTSTYPEQQWLLLDALTRLLPVLTAELRLIFQQQGVVDFTEISLAASAALGRGLNPSELAMKLDYQLHHILVDEFQDTASTQYNLLQRLVEGWSEHNMSNPENPKTLFIVGDGMQSIYGFREANVGLFLDAKKNGVNGINLDDLRLTVNFRSTPQVVDWVNNTFSTAFPSHENISRGAVPYEFANPFNAAQSDSVVKVLGFSGESATSREVRKIVDIIENAELENKTISIAILVRSRSGLADIIPALSRAGIKWSAKDINPLLNYSAVADLFSLTKALLNIADDVSWAALLRAPWIGLDNSDMHCLLGDKPSSNSVFSRLVSKEISNSMTTHGVKRIKIVASVLLTAYEDRQRLNLRSWIEGIWLALGGASTVTCLEEYSYVDAYFELLENLQPGEGRLSLRDLENAIGSLYAEPLVEEANLHIMTIHKAKGLEFDVVILPGLARSSRSDDKTLLMWREYMSDRPAAPGSTGLIISPVGETGSDEDTIYKHLRYEQSITTALEETRLVYVAATRSIKQLYVLFSTPFDEKSERPRPPSKNSLLSRIWSSIEDSVVWDCENELATEQYGLDFSSEDLTNNFTRIQKEWRAPDFNSSNPLTEYYLESSAISDYKNIPNLSIDLLPISVGNICHWILEMLGGGSHRQSTVSLSENRWSTFSDASRKIWLEALLQYDGLEKQYWPQAIDEIIENINGTLSDKIGRWILFGNHKEQTAELALLSLSSTTVDKRIIDRCFIDDKNDCWIVDYKTSRLREDELAQDFFDRVTERYSHQLLGYRDQLSQIPPYCNTKKIRVALYFTSYSHWSEVETPQITSTILSD